MNILLLAAGRGQRFVDAGYQPKPLIDVNGKPMWQAVLDNFLPFTEPVGRKNYVVTKAEYGIDHASLEYGFINLIDQQFGAAWSALKAVKESGMDEYDSLWILNCDQMISGEIVQIADQKIEGTNGAILHFEENDGEFKWGRSVVNADDGYIDAVVEKIPVTPWAHTGHYFWKNTGEFIHYAEKLIEKNIQVNGEFFLSPIYNLMIADGRVISPLFVEKFWGIGEPADLERYLNETR